MKSGDRVELVDDSHPHKGEIGTVAKINWRDNEQVWVIFDNWLRDKKRQAAFSPRWWSVHVLRNIGHENDNVYADFQEVLAFFRQQAVTVEASAKIAEYILETWGVNLGVEDVEALFFISEEKTE